MQPDSDIIISDTSCLILLSIIDELNLLGRLSNKVFITPDVKKEFGRVLPGWIQIKRPKDKHYQKILEMDLDVGEASAIALSFDFANSILIIDDLKGRKIAENLNIRYSGTFGLILRAKQAGIIETVTPLLNKIRNTNFRFSENLINAVLKEAGE